MREHTVCAPKPSTVLWEHLDEFVRQQIQGVLQQLLDEEVNALLGRLKSQRRAQEAAAGSAPAAYRNGYGKLRQVSTVSGTVTVRRPRIRGLAQRLESRVLPLFARRTRAVG